MKRNACYVIMGVFILAILCFSGCGGGGETSNNTKGTTANILKGVGWGYYNSAIDYMNNGATCLLAAKLYYAESIATSDIDSFSVTAPNGWHWTVTSPNISFNTTGSGKPYIGACMSYGDNPQAFPLAGLWTFEIKQKTGETSLLQESFHEPGSAVDATHFFLYTKEDWTPSTDPAQYVAALSRFPSQGYTVQYSTAGVGSITTTGLSGVNATFLGYEPNAYNFNCWLYDDSKGYLGYTISEYSSLDHSRTNLITANGELSIEPVSVYFSNGPTDLSKVKYIRFVYYDGLQFVPGSYSNWDQSSISSLIPVN